MFCFSYYDILFLVASHSICCKHLCQFDKYGVREHALTKRALFWLVWVGSHAMYTYIYIYINILEPRRTLRTRVNPLLSFFFSLVSLSCTERAICCKWNCGLIPLYVLVSHRVKIQHTNKGFLKVSLMVGFLDFFLPLRKECCLHTCARPNYI